MKIVELHILNRIYIYPLDRGMIHTFGIAENIIQPALIRSILEALDDDSFHLNLEKGNYSLALDYPNPEPNAYYKGIIKREFIYIVTKNLDIFKSVRNVENNAEAIYQWLIEYQNYNFIATHPIFNYRDMPHTFNIHRMKFASTDIHLDTLLKEGKYTFGDGFNIALSMNALGHWSDAALLEAIQRFYCESPARHRAGLHALANVNWLQYYGIYYVRNSPGAFLYAYQYCSPDIYRCLYEYTLEEDLSYNTFKLEDNITTYISNIFTNILSPKKHHYDFLKETKQTKQVNQYLENSFMKRMHINIHQRLINVIENAQNLRDFLGKGYLYNLFIHCIYINKKLALLKVIQSLTFLYNHSDYSKRSIKYIWRLLLREFKEEFIKAVSIYLLEYHIYMFNRKISNCLSYPPTKMVRDAIYLLQDKLYYKQDYTLKIALKQQHECRIQEDINYTMMTSASNNIYSFNMSLFDILKLLNHPMHKKLQQRNVLLFATLKNYNYEIYRIMQSHYLTHPDELWKRTIKIKKRFKPSRITIAT